MISLFEAFRSNREHHPETTAFMISAGDRSVPISWRQFAADIDATAWVVRTYSGSGVVALLGENSYEWMTAHAACIFSGATVVPIEDGLSAVEIADRLRMTGAVVLIHSALYAEKAAEAGRLAPGVQIGEFGSRRTDGFINQGRAALAAGEKSLFDRPPPDEEKTAMIVFTSGTTSRPKGAELTLRALAVFAECARRRLDVKRGDRSLMVLPVYHIFGLCAAYFMLAEGVALGVCPDFRRLYDTVGRFRVNCICLVPALAEILAEKIAQRSASAEEAFGSPIDWILTGGAPLPRRTYENLTALGIQTLTAYGLTETTAVFSMAVAGEDPHVGSAGRICDLPGVDVKVSDEGILMIKGPNVFKGYYRDPDGTAAVLSPDGWFSTGDYGRIDADGTVWVTGRASRTIVLSSGKKVAPEELEMRILALPGIREAVVSGDGAARDIQAEVYAVLPEGSVRKAIAALNRTLPVYKRVRSVVVRTEPFARTGSGKIRMNGADRKSVPAEAAPPAAAEDRPAVGRVIRKAMRVPFAAIFLLMAAALALSALGFVPDMLEIKGVTLPGSLRRFFAVADIAGELLIFFFAFWVVLKVWDSRR